MSDEVDNLEQIRACICELGRWPEELGDPLAPPALDLYAALD
jgi:hypothetical protein